MNNRFYVGMDLEPIADIMENGLQALRNWELFVADMATSDPWTEQHIITEEKLIEMECLYHVGF